MPPRAPTHDAADDELALPHERDQSEPSATAPQDTPPEIEQAARDLEAGLVDTDLRGTPGADAPQREQLLRRERNDPEKPGSAS